MNVFGTVKASINTREAAARYGVEVNRHGKALCPFHNDRHPSWLGADLPAFRTFFMMELVYRVFVGGFFIVRYLRLKKRGSIINYSA